ncbi:hypothetical protein GCM10020254_66290 [Streptomyces goshikiensis]
MVGAHVDDEDLVAELGGDGGGLTVRQGEEHDIMSREHLGGGRLQGAAGERDEVRLERTEGLPGVGVRGQRADLHLGVREQQAQYLTARVPARPGHRCTNHHRTLLVDGMTIRTYARLCNALSRGPFGPAGLRGRVGGGRLGGGGVVRRRGAGGRPAL